MSDLEYLHLRVLLWLAKNTGFLGLVAFFASPLLILAGLLVWSIRQNRRRDA